MDYRTLRIFVSSRMLELAEERRRIKAALASTRVNAWVYEDDAGAAPGTIEQTYLDELDKADLYLGVFWRDFGQYTIEEYEHAEKVGKDRLVYEKRADIEGKRDPRLQAFLDRIVQVKSGVTSARFDGVDRLVALVLQDVPKLLTANYRARVAARSGAPFQAPALRLGFVPRPESLARLRDRLLAEPAQFRVVALHGMPGSGKSALAIAAAHDKKIVDHYSDGILWVTLGLEPNLSLLLGSWLQALGEREQSFADAASAQRHLQTVLQDRAVLLVVDDAWDPSHVNELTAGGPRCTVLVTTREALVARAARAASEDTVELGVMHPEEALALLAGGPDRSLSPEAEAPALEVARAVGFLPLALDLARAQVAEGVAWGELAADLRGETKRLESLDDAALSDVADVAIRRQLSLVASLHVSLRRLAPERLAQLAWLGVLREDSPLPPGAAATLWGTDERSARDALRHLRSKGLLIAGDPTADGASTYLVHDVVHAMAFRLLAAPPAPADAGQLAGLGLTALEAHTRFLDRHQARRQGDRWHTLVDDGYIFDHLLWHLQRAGRIGEIHAVLREVTAQDRNGWFVARESRGQSAGYAADVGSALEIAAGDLGLAMRYSLMRVSLRSIASNVPPTLVAAALQHGVWSLPQALAYAAAALDSAQRALALTLIAQQRPAPQNVALLLDARTAARGLKEDPVGALPLLAGRLAAAGLTDEALEVARQAEFGDPRAGALMAAYKQVPPEARAGVLEEAIEIVDGTGELFRAAALEQVLPHLDEAQVRGFIAKTQGMREERFKSATLALLLPRLGELGHADEARSLLPDVSDAVAHVHAMVGVAQRLPAVEGGVMIDDALVIAATVDDEVWLDQLETALPDMNAAARSVLRFVASRVSWRTQLLEALPENLPDALLRRALDLALGSREAAHVASSFSVLAPRLTPALRDEGMRRVVEAATAARSGDEVEALAALLPTAGAARAELLEQAWRAVDTIGLDIEKKEAVEALLPMLADDEIDRVLATAAEFSDTDERRGLISSLAPRLTEEQVRRALDAASAITDEEEQAMALASLAAHLGAREAARVLARATALPPKYPRVAVLALLAAQLPDELVESVLESGVALAAAKPELFAQSLAVPLAARVSEPRRTGLLREAVEAATSMGDIDRMSEIARTVTPQLSPELFEEVLASLTAAADRLPDLRPGYAAFRIQLAMCPRLDRSRRARLIEAAFDLLERDPAHPGDVLEFLAHNVEPDQFERLVDLVKTFDDAYVKAISFGLMLPGTPPDRREELVAEALSQVEHFTPDEYLSVDDKAQKLGVLVLPYMSDVECALDLVETFQDQNWRAQALIGLAPGVPARLASRAIEMARALEVSDRGLALLAVEPTAAKDKQTDLVEDAWTVMVADESSLHGDVLLETLSARLCGLGPDTLRGFLQARVPQLANLPRAQLLIKVKHLTPAFVHAGGPAVAQQIFDAIEDVTRWWP